MKLFGLMIICLFSSCTTCNSQRVNNGAYNLMLNVILKEDVPTISVKEAVSLHSNNKNVVFIDTREKEEYNVSHIKNALWVGYKNFSIDRLNGIDKDTKIVAYCSVGARSEKVTRKLNKAGFSDVNNLYGSIFEWVNQGNSVVNNSGEETLKVHAYNKKWGIWLKKGEKVYE